MCMYVYECVYLVWMYVLCGCVCICSCLCDVCVYGCVCTWFGCVVCACVHVCVCMLGVCVFSIHGESLAIELLKSTFTWPPISRHMKPAA